MNLGTAWIIIEEHFHSNEKQLISILSARRSREYICDYIEQTYVDKYASFNERIDFKKNKKKSPFRIEKYECKGTIISYGHDPMFKAYYCHKLKLSEKTLLFSYRVFKGDFEHREINEYHSTIKIA